MTISLIIEASKHFFRKNQIKYNNQKSHYQYNQ